MELIQFSTIELFIACVREPETPKLVKMRSAGTRMHFRKYTWEWEEGSETQNKIKKSVTVVLSYLSHSQGHLGTPPNL